ncbi:MAG: DUF4347 domain-containing protein [Nostoc sp. NMS1]|uniref:FG-GAP-like repeat-containing protein n=1 Tax=unclassified Nostoc TaxID=2593658 RepID=UPI0025DBAC62|nr:MULTISPECIES: FG-GAP-like repeat-containing protein [unclassified Nostoc]MBN3907847.1 DUF4347 domain-containing protein [Nostoc sp. NMS1]MBN3994041.1 DUF4347 domain-containing protein [Nostoc sp. NMS2]
MSKIHHPSTNNSFKSNSANLDAAPEQQHRSIVFIDANVADAAMLAKGVKSGIKAIVLDPNSDGITQITQALQTHPKISEIHLVAHGVPGCLTLGNSQLSLDTLNHYGPQLMQWFAHAQKSTDSTPSLLLYGCNVAAGDAGAAFLDQLHQLTKARIAASAQRVGSAELGGSWQLEAQRGSVSTKIVFTATLMHSYGGVFALDFDPADSFGVGTAPVFVAVGDLNGDGNQDIVATNATSDNISVLLGDGTGNFAPAVNYAVGDQPRGVAIGDFNGDGNDDLAVTNYSSNNVYILLNNGSGSFTSSGTFNVGNAPNEVAIGDFNGDRKSDMVIANNFSSNLTVLFGNGLGGFPSSTTLAVNDNTATVDVGDINGDGKLDIVSASAGPKRVSAFLGDGAGGFTLASNFGVNSFPNSVKIADFNNDGKADIATTNASPGKVSVLLGNGDGSFTPGANFAAGSNTTRLTTADFNGDGNTDVAVASNGTGKILVLLGDGTGSFDPAVGFATAPSPYALTTGDFNNDGKVDLVSANPGSNNVSVLLNTSVFGNTAPTDLSLDNTIINENVVANTIVGTFSTTDPEGGSFSYALVTGTGDGDNSAFTLNGNQLKINASPNFEAKSSYSIRVKTTDAGGLSYEKPFTIGITNVNEAPTNLALSNATVNENVPGNTTVGSFSTTDPEGGNFTYALVTGTGDGDNSAFTIVNGNQLKINASPDFETKSSYSIRVKTTDAGGLSYEEAIAIGITNLNEAPTATGDSTSAYKNTPKTIAAATLLANDTDPDAGTTLKITSVSNATNGSVSLNSSGDVVFTAANTGNASFQYTTSDGSLTSTATVAVSVGLNLNGGNGIDLLWGSEYDDLLNGNDGADALYGDKGNDILNGGKGIDLLDGGQGNDILNGGDNADALYGGKGNDTLIGGASIDFFFFAKGGGSDTITDFTDKTDKIGLIGGLSFGQLTISASGSNTLIGYGSETLATLTGVNSSLITFADFV